MDKKQKKLLKEIFDIPAPSEGEAAMQLYIIRFLKKHKINYDIDKVGNIYNVDEYAPLLCAHLDTVQGVTDIEGIDSIKIRKGILKGKGIIGGDDKCGIFIMLNLLMERPSDFNFLFTVEEEIGALGSSDFVGDWMEYMPYALILDRRGKGDIICSENSYGTLEFEEELFKVGAPYGYKPSHGSFSDADSIAPYLCCANLSVGYYKPHTKNEYVIIKHLMNAYDYVWAILTHITNKYEPADYYGRYTYKSPTTAFNSKDFDKLWGYEGYKYGDDSDPFDFDDHSDPEKKNADIPKFNKHRILEDYIINYDIETTSEGYKPDSFVEGKYRYWKTIDNFKIYTTYTETEIIRAELSDAEKILKGELKPSDIVFQPLKVWFRIHSRWVKLTIGEYYDYVDLYTEAKMDYKEMVKGLKSTSKTPIMVETSETEKGYTLIETLD